jgi:hypothetical protein
LSPSNACGSPSAPPLSSTRLVERVASASPVREGRVLHAAVDAFDRAAGGGDRALGLGAHLAAADRASGTFGAEDASAVTDETLHLRSILTCPACETRTIEIMPLDACKYFYECSACGALLKPGPGDCCVFCSYGDAPCPPIQQARPTGLSPSR